METVSYVTQVEDINEETEEAALPFLLVLDGGCATVASAASLFYPDVITSEDGIVHHAELGEVEYVGVK